MFHRMRTPLLALAIFCATSWALMAQDPPTITIRKGDKLNVALASFAGSGGAQARKILENDLTVVGGFTISKGDQGTYVISGTARGSTLDGRVTDRTGGTVISKTYTGGSRTAVHRFADDIVQALTGKPGIADSKLAFVSTRSGRKEIYLCDYDGANVRQLTHDNSISVAPSLSPDGNRLAYTGYKSGYADVYLIDLPTGSRRRIVKFPGTNRGAAFAPNGSRLALTVSRDGNPEIYTINTNGGGAKRLTRTRGVESSPTWSPNGRELIYSSDDRGRPQLYRIGSGGGRGRMLNSGYGYCTEPNWSPDGAKIAFNIRTGGTFRVAVLDLAGGGSRVLTSGGNAEDPAWGPNSRHLVYAQGRSLYLLDAETGKTFKVISGLGKVSEPSWSR